MNFRLVSAFVFPFLLLSNGATAQRLAHDIPYVENGHKRHVLDVYTPENRRGKSLPVMFWPQCVVDPVLDTARVTTFR